MKIARIILLIILSLIVLAALALAAYYLAGMRATGSLLVNGEKRSYLLYVPESYDPQTPTPLVITLHGYAGWPAEVMRTSRWNRLADEDGFLVVYPSGLDFPRRWRMRGEPGSSEDAALETAFISALLDELESQYNIDPQRIYANGISNGGGMSHVLACQLSNRIAAIGSVAGAYIYPDEACQPARQVPLIAFHGTDDNIVPFGGGPSHSFEIDFPDVPTWMAEWAERNQCAADPQPMAARGFTNGVHYAACAGNADVIFYTVGGGGHSWPGGKPLPRFITGPTSMDVDASALMWAFFQQHPLQP